MSTKMLKTALAAALASGLMTGVAEAYQAGDWLVRAGVWGIYPKSDNLNLGPNTDINVDDSYSLGFNITYMATPNIGIELLGAWPFSHDISLSGVGTIGDTKQLPPTISVQYHFLPDSNFRPYVGLGLNYTFFFDESTEGALSGSDLKLDDSWGLAAQVGMDFDVAPNWFLNVDVRYIDIESKAKLDGVSIGTVEIDPWVVGFNVGTRF
ncbi:MAG TPA: OmpW family outer membrane protein [Candidatus Competibacter sp.]|jgi:outer membrane protein|nr:OmpW family outer membrane protein [Candidatus Competibacter sp.]HRX62863.1 OmpW family outer membrane protein [Candidatus Competibacter sp.]